MKLTIELVPSTSWYNNVRSNVSKKEWDKIRKSSYKKAKYRCEICNGVGINHPVECHEIWHYDDINKIQTLKGFISLCPSCHKVKHAGLAEINDESHLVISQLMEVNNLNELQACSYFVDAGEKWIERSKYEWKLDISYLDDISL